MLLPKRIFFSGLLVVVTLLVQNADALLNSSYAEREENWQGRRIHEEGDFKTLIEFTVYYKGGDMTTEESSFVNQLGLLGDYVYAYQIFQHQTDSQGIGSFSVLDIDGLSIEGRTINDATWQNQPDGDETAIAADEYPEEGVWRFGGFGLENGEHSWFMVYSSDSEPVVGSYGLYIPGEGPGEGEPPVPGSEESATNPEPGMLALFGLGGAILLRGRRKTI